MPLHGSGTALAYLSLYRVCHVDGRYGGGKTALCWRLAYELVMSGKFRYIVSNVNSPWRDRAENVVLRDGVYADTVVILDEGGLFLKTGADVEQFLAYLRKMNITILIPSVEPPTMKVQKFSIMRTMNLQAYGLPVWVYDWRLKTSRVKENGYMYWRNPQEIYGCYDTRGMPSDDGGLNENFIEWVKQAAEKIGYSSTAKKAQSRIVGTSISFGEVHANAGESAGQATALDGFRWAINDLEQVQENISNLVSSSDSPRRKRGR